MIPLISPRLRFHNVPIHASTQACSQHDEPRASSGSKPSCRVDGCGDEDVFGTVQDHDALHNSPVNGVGWFAGEAIQRVAGTWVEHVRYAEAEKDCAEDGGYVGQDWVTGEAHCGRGVGPVEKKGW